MNRSNEHADIVIVGGGAAGLAAAIAAGEALRASAVGCVVVCEASDRVGRSILATGNGRCNFSNARLTEEVLSDATALEPFYHNADFAARVFAALEGLSLFGRDGSELASYQPFCANTVQRFFAFHGLVWREDEEGRLYPLANKASSVLDVLRAAAQEGQVDQMTDATVRSIGACANGSDGFVLKMDDGRELHAQQVIVAAGGSIEKIEALPGLRSVQLRPVLGPLAMDETGKRTTKRLDNIRVKASVALLRDGAELMREQGEVLFRSYGLSGIAVFDLSREAMRGDEISLDLLPQVPHEQTEGFLMARVDRERAVGASAVSYGDVLRGITLPRVTEALCERAKLNADAPCDAKGIGGLARSLHDMRFRVEGIGDARQCQVKRGGVSVDTLDESTLEVEGYPGLYVVGEAADVDAACGGFNLHWAWASGMLAGHAAARRMMRAAEEGR